MVRTYKPETVLGYRIEFVDRGYNIFARAPAISSQFIGAGKTKAAAFKEAKESMRHFKKVGTI
jgi:hypothetical protein